MIFFYWSAERGTGEIDFLVQMDDKIIPIEVKAEENLQAKSLRTFVQKYNMKYAVRTSMSDYREQDWMGEYPIVLCWKSEPILSGCGLQIIENVNWKIIQKYHIICCESLLYAGSFAVNCTPKYTKNPTALYRLLSFLAI